MDVWIILILIAASAVGSWLIFRALRHAGQSKQDYHSFAQSKGWAYEAGAAGSADTAFLRDPNDNWTLRIIFSGDGAYDGMTHRRIEWHTPDGALHEGEAVLGMPLPAQTVSMLQGGGAMGQSILKAALKATLHALGKTRFDLTIDDATAGDPGGVVMASTGHAQAMDALRRNETLAQFRATHKQADVPVILRDADGLKLRRPGAAKSLDDLVALVDLGLSLRADL